MSPDQFDESFLAVQSGLVGEYSLERELGRGGMGIVYLAREVRLDRLVAIKVLPPHLAANEDLRARFLRESQTAARLSHPNIVPIFRVGEANDFVYFAMAYVEGETLTERVRSKGPLPPQVGTRILREAAWALAYAHARGIVHRDVKPDNILLEHGSGRAMLTDFGIAHVEAPSSLTDAGLVLGTAQYMSPEQAAGEKLDGRSDLYSLGIVAHFMFAGRVPFDDPSVSALLAKQITQPAPPLVSRAPAVPRRVGETIDRCLAKSPDQRFTTGEALADALTGASETPHEIPAPIRVWIAKGEQSRGVGLFIIGYLSLGFIPLMITVNPLFVLAPFALLGAAMGLPALIRTRRVLRAGYGLDDLRSALRVHWTRRREELVYDSEDSSRVIRYVLWTISGLSWAAMLGALLLGPTRFGSDDTWDGFMAVGGTLGTATGLLGLFDYLRRRRVTRAGSMNLKFWNSRWAEKLVALARTGLKNVASAPAAPQLTEVALGRATDLLFQALPAPMRKDLRELPAAVRSLEADAHKMRHQIEQIERHLVDFGSEASRPPSRSLAASAEQDQSVAGERARVAAELEATRDLARSRLAATVASLENIRLGLLRLQLGSAPVESVTAALEAAQRVADDVGRQVAAETEASAMLKRGGR
jgi:predicted Ser/Thr protein kinase